MNIILLTHKKEIQRKTGTGKIVKQALMDNCQIIPWERVNPSQLLEKELDPSNSVLVYPLDDGEENTNIDLVENFIIIDGTWQEANKIYNRSPYLKRFKKYGISSSLKSTYNLRRNQKDIGLCTAETIIEISKEKGYLAQVDSLEKSFKEFIDKYKRGQIV